MLLNAFYQQVDNEFQSMFSEQTSAKLISTWETRFVPGILHISKMSKLPKILSLLEELFHPSFTSRIEGDDLQDDDYVPTSGKVETIAYRSND